jgi:hypothetical protein
MGFEMVFSTRPTKEMQNLLRVLFLRHKPSWLSFAEAFASTDASAFRYGEPEHVGVLSVIVAKRELVQVERQILSADVVVRAQNASLQEAPEIINVAGVNVSPNIFVSAVTDRLVPIAASFEPVVTLELIRCDEIDFVAYGLLDKATQSSCINLFDHPADDVSFTADCADDRCFSRPTGYMLFFAPVAILVFPAKIGFIDFDNPHQFLEFFVLHSRPQSVAHIPSCWIRPANLPLNLKCANALFAIEHLPENFKPSFQGHVRVLEDRAYCDREAVERPTFRPALRTRPVKGARGNCKYPSISASRTSYAFRPTAVHKELPARFFGRECFKKLFECHHGEKHSTEKPVCQVLFNRQIACQGFGRLLPRSSFPAAREALSPVV